MKKLTIKDFRRIAKTATHTFSEWCGDTIRGEKAAALKVAVLFEQNKVRLSEPVKEAVLKNGFKLYTTRRD
jgi:hypothetical protein